MRRTVVGAALALALVGCTKADPPPPDFYATLEVIRAELTAMAPAPPVLATATPGPVTAPTAEPTPAPTAATTPVPAAPTATPPSEAPPAPTAELSPTPTVSWTPTPVQYTVQRGDYLGTIAAEYGVSVEALIAANDIADPNVIEVGQVLVIPAPEATPAP